jgi:hypothetical protein
MYRRGRIYKETPKKYNNRKTNIYLINISCYDATSFRLWFVSVILMWWRLVCFPSDSWPKKRVKCNKKLKEILQ